MCKSVLLVYTLGDDKCKSLCIEFIICARICKRLFFRIQGIKHFEGDLLSIQILTECVSICSITHIYLNTVCKGIWHVIEGICCHLGHIYFLYTDL